MKRIFYGLFLAMAYFLVAGCATQNSAKNINPDDFGIHFIEINGGFSMYAPKDWEIADTSLKYKILMGPAENNFSPNINFSEEEFTGEVSDYIDACLELLPQIFANFELLERTGFITNGGVQGGRITTQGRLNDIQVRQRIYIIPNKKNTAIIGITCTISPSMRTRYDAIFDKCVGTFEWK
jgi:hypothetical protein